MANSNNAGEDFCITNSLLKSMLPIGEQVDVKPLLMATDFFNTSTWRSLVMVGQNQVQRNGLLFQAALTHASLGQQVTYIMKREFSRFPPTTHTYPKMGAENMANITFKYCPDIKDVEQILIDYCNSATDLLPHILVVNGLNEFYHDGQHTPSQYQLSKIFSLLSETLDYIGRKRQTATLMFVSIALPIASDKQPDWERLLERWVHEVWVLEGNSNRLAYKNNQVQFTVLGSNIYLKAVSKKLE